MKLWKHLGFIYYKCQCIWNHVHFLLYEHYVVFYLIEHDALQEVVWQLVF
jgi:hypothetical protein